MEAEPIDFNHRFGALQAQSSPLLRLEEGEDDGLENWLGRAKDVRFVVVSYLIEREKSRLPKRAFRFRRDPTLPRYTSSITLLALN